MLTLQLLQAIAVGSPATSASLIEMHSMVFQQLWLQLQELHLSNNQLVGSLPEAWSKLTNVSPVTQLTLPCQSV